jgi:hypothetical protein
LVAARNPPIPRRISRRGARDDSSLSGPSSLHCPSAWYSATRTMLTFLVDACRIRFAS